MPLSTAPIPARERLIFALDVESTAAARDLVAQLGDSVWFYKLGLSLIFDEGYWPLVAELRRLGKRSFADLKLFDVPETVAGAVRKLVGRGPTLATVHAHEAMIRAAVAARGADSDLKILAVTVLTSLDEGDLRALGFQVPSVADLVLSRAARMLECGADGVVASGLEAERLRGALGDKSLIVVPGIRPVANAPDDQKRVATVEAAFAAGADYIVVGRPIRNAPDPRRAAADIQDRIARLFPNS